MANYFEECQKCVPPKRHPGCHGTCPDYAKARAKYDADKAKAEAGNYLWEERERDEYHFRFWRQNCI